MQLNTGLRWARGLSRRVAVAAPRIHLDSNAGECSTTIQAGKKVQLIAQHDESKKTSLVTFSNARLAAPVIVNVETGSKLIDCVRPMAIEGRLPLYWRCGQGTCGACLVFIEHQHSGSVDVQLGGKERNVLARLGRLTPAQQSASSLPDSVQLPRLACHVLIPEGEVSVYWPVDAD